MKVLSRSLALLLAAVLVLGTVPALAEEPVQLLWMPTVLNGSTIYPQDDCFVAQQIDERFGVDIMIQNVNAQKNDEVALMFASGTVPDVNVIFPKYVAGYMDQELFRDIPLAMLEEYAPTLYQRIQNSVDINSLPVMADGKLYGLPHCNFTFYLGAIRTDWLDRLSLAMPATLEDFEEVARAFAQDDPDGNGVDDTYLLSWCDKYDTNFLFVKAAFGLDTDFVLESGALQDTRMTESYKAYLHYIQDLYAKGYVYPDLTMPQKDNISELFTNGTVGYFVDSQSWLMKAYRPSAYYARLFEQNPGAATAFVPPFMVNGERAANLTGNSIWAYTCVGYQTTDEQLIKILQILEAQVADFAFHNLIWRGVEGVHYTVADNGMALYTDDYKVLDKQQELGLKTFFINMRRDEEIVISYGAEFREQSAFCDANYVYTSRLIPEGAVTAAGQEYGADVDAVAKEFFMKALTGNVDIDAQWDEYLHNMRQAGADKIMAEYNQIYATLHP